MKRRRISVSSMIVGLALGSVVTVAVLEGPYLNWQPCAAPVEAQPLVFRQDAKGDGHFLSPRSGNRRHQGVDLVAELNSPVHAIRSGMVLEVGTHRGLGRFVTLEHDHDMRSRYAHLNSVLVQPGARIRQGAVIGTVGKTGNARHRWITPHLHLELLQRGQPVDPQLLGLKVVDPMPRPSAVSSVESSDASGGE